MKFHIPDTKEFSVRSKQSAQKNLIKSPPPPPMVRVISCV